MLSNDKTHEVELPELAPLEEGYNTGDYVVEMRHELRADVVEAARRLAHQIWLTEPGHEDEDVRRVLWAVDRLEVIDARLTLDGVPQENVKLVG